MKAKSINLFQTLFILLICPFFYLNILAETIENKSVSSPSGKVKVLFSLSKNGEPLYSVEFNGKTILLESKLGLVRNDVDFSQNLSFVSSSKTKVNDNYEILTAKRRFNSYNANGVVYRLKTIDGKQLNIIFQVSNDGVAFRYYFPNTDAKTYRLTDEKTTFHFSTDTKAWLQPMAKAQTGWEKSQPSYEEYYEKEIPVGTPSTLGVGWIYPALFRSGKTWILLSETNMQRDYCGTRLSHESPNGEYKVTFPDALETCSASEPVNPESTLPWASPWRVIVVGNLATITESMLGVDFAEPSIKKSAVQPGKSSWSWVLLGDRQTNYETSRRFIDYAAEMGWQYCLIDALWDKQIGYEKIKELVDYAKTKKVKIILWYNSAGSWNTTPQTPRNQMLTRESRLLEFKRIKEIGVAGLKVDFFGGDGQSFMNYYLDILDDAAKFDLAMNFHGATLPRGIQRKYPNLMTMEAIRGFEFVTFEQANADQQASHSAMMPFTRNVFDPMDFTPMALDRVNNRIKRQTTSSFELATAILFTSGIQHYAETPEGMAKIPNYVRDFIKGIPSIWEDVKFIDGYPAKFAVLARKSGNRWYIAGINGELNERKLTIPLEQIAKGKSWNLINDGEGNMSFTQQKFDSNKNKTIEITIKPNGGFVIVSD